MITVETQRPVYSNANGASKVYQVPDGKGGFKDATEAEYKKYRRSKAWTTAKNVYGKAKESGLLQATENLVLKQGSNEGAGGTELPPPPPQDEKKPMSKTTKTILIVSGVAVVGFAIYWFAIRKAPQK